MEEECCGCCGQGTGWVKIVNFIVKIIGILTVLSLIIINIAFTASQMHGCEGRPDITLHLFLVELLVVYLSWYILTDGIIDPNEVIREMSRLGERFLCDEERYHIVLGMMVIVLVVFLLSGGTVMGWYMVYSIAIIPRGCTVPPSVLARVYYWTVGGVFGLLGILCLVTAVGGTSYGIYKGCKFMCEQYKDNRRAKRLLQTVNRASLGAQSRITVLYEDIRTALYLNSEHSNTYNIAHKILTENILNLCTVYASDICDESSDLSILCPECDYSLEPTDSVVVLYEKDVILHRKCISVDEYLTGSIAIRRTMDNLWIEVKDIARDRPLWDIEDIRRCRIIIGKEIYEQIINRYIEQRDQQESMHEEVPLDHHSQEAITPASRAGSMDNSNLHREYSPDSNPENIEPESRDQGQREESEGNWMDDHEDRGERNEEKIKIARVGQSNSRKVKRFIRIVKPQATIKRVNLLDEEEEMEDRK